MPKGVKKNNEKIKCFNINANAQMWSVNLCKHLRALSCVAFSRTHAQTQIIIVTLMADSALHSYSACCMPSTQSRLWVAAANSHRRQSFAFQLHLSLYTRKRKEKKSWRRRAKKKKILQAGETFGCVCQRQPFLQTFTDQYSYSRRWC